MDDRSNFGWSWVDNFLVAALRARRAIRRELRVVLGPCEARAVAEWARRFVNVPGDDHRGVVAQELLAMRKLVPRGQCAAHGRGAVAVVVADDQARVALAI